MVFDIGIFPWMCLTATTLFLNPSWPRLEELATLIKISEEKSDPKVKNSSKAVKPKSSKRGKVINFIFVCFSSFLIYIFHIHVLLETQKL